MKHSPITTRFTKTQFSGLASACALGALLALGGCASNPSNAQIGTASAPLLAAWSARCSVWFILLTNIK